eukprot:13282795-Alexandrium_andersonii.AAC.1
MPVIIASPDCAPLSLMTAMVPKRCPARCPPLYGRAQDPFSAARGKEQGVACPLPTQSVPGAATEVAIKGATAHDGTQRA